MSPYPLYHVIKCRQQSALNIVPSAPSNKVQIPPFYKSTSVHNGGSVPRPTLGGSAFRPMFGGSAFRPTLGGFAYVRGLSLSTHAQGLSLSTHARGVSLSTHARGLSLSTYAWGLRLCSEASTHAWGLCLRSGPRHLDPYLGTAVSEPKFKYCVVSTYACGFSSN
jgi:hypothetical protein